MEKIKTYVIIISLQYPKTHSKAGTQTGFNSKIKQGIKIHTIRLNFKLWEKRIKNIQEGKACISIRKWTGLPYRSFQEELFRFDKSDGVGIEKFQIGLGGVYIDGKFISATQNIIDALAHLDGLAVEDFCEWFKKVRVDDELAIIHFTDFRYNSQLELDN